MGSILRESKQGWFARLRNSHFATWGGNSQWEDSIRVAVFH